MRSSVDLSNTRRYELRLLALETNRNITILQLLLSRCPPVTYMVFLVMFGLNMCFLVCLHEVGIN